MIIEATSDHRSSGSRYERLLSRCSAATTGNDNHIDLRHSKRPRRGLISGLFNGGRNRRRWSYNKLTCKRHAFVAVVEEHGTTTLSHARSLRVRGRIDDEPRPPGRLVPLEPYRVVLVVEPVRLVEMPDSCPESVRRAFRQVE